MTRKRVTFVGDVDGDWEGMYLGNDLVREGHSLRVGDVLEALGIDYSSYEIDLAEYGRCPTRLRDAMKMTPKAV